MRVATYNVHDCIGRDRRFDPQRVIDILVDIDADVLALQEVTVDSAGELIRRFETATGMQAVDGSLFERGIGRYGNLLLTRKQVLKTRLHDLSHGARELRGAVEAVLSVSGRPLGVLATHLGLQRRERRVQLNRLAQIVDERESTAVILGDLNLWSQRFSLRPIVARGFGFRAVRSFPIWPRPIVALDMILVREPIVVKDCWRYTTPPAQIASDHFPVVAELSVR